MISGSVIASTISSTTRASGRVGHADDIGPRIARLLGEAKRWVTVQLIEVSGGQVI